MRAHDEAPSKRGWPWVGGPVRDAVVRGCSGPEKFTCLYLEGSTDSLYRNVYIYICVAVRFGRHSPGSSLHERTGLELSDWCRTSLDCRLWRFADCALLPCRPLNRALLEFRVQGVVLLGRRSNLDRKHTISIKKPTQLLNP